jgi:LysM repeat protein
MMAIIKALAAVLVLAVLTATAWYVREVKAQVATPQLAALPVDPVEDVEPGDIAFERAVERLALGHYEEAEERLQFVVNFDPGSEAAVEARRILGELHLDRYLSTEDMEGKAIHEVKSGDSFLKIAKEYDTTIDCLVHLNGLMRLDQLHPGDELVVMPLDFNLRLDLPRKRLSVWKDGRFVTSYEIEDVRLGHSASAVLRTKVRNKQGFLDGQSYPTTSDQYRGAHKILTLEDKGLRILGKQEEEEAGDARGIFLKESDMEELVLLTRVGNVVEVRYSAE